MSTAVLNNGLKATWYGHATVLLETPGGKRVMIDPFVQSNPACPKALHDVANLDLLLITHGHGDHMGDALSVIQLGQPKNVIAIHEIAVWLSGKGVQNVSGMNHGGTQEAEGLKVTMTPAIHSSSMQDGDDLVPGGTPAGYVIALENGYRVYHAGDTALFGDMALIGELWKPDLAFLPIGDHYTMGPAAAARAARLLGVKRVVPIHYGTFPVLTGTPDQLREAGKADGLEVIALRPGETLS
ncbi:MAG: metal-dependent hydrolase [Chloroflexi bacterium]|nr:metal-dependent hydrolase [Chloroflexota bacterium]